MARKHMTENNRKFMLEFIHEKILKSVLTESRTGKSN